MINRILTASEHLSFNSLVEVETNISDKGLPIFEISGLISKSIDESKKRVITAIENSGLTFPLKNILVNLSPASLQKSGTHYDLPIAVSIIKDRINIPFADSVFIGELSFDGSVRGVENIFYLVISSIERGIKHIYVPKECIGKLQSIDDVNFYPILNIKDLFNLSNLSPASFSSKKEISVLDNETYSRIEGNYSGKKAIAYSLIGRHSILIQGPPGVGKSMLAKSMYDLAPDLTKEEYINVSKIYSYSGISREKEGFKVPFRSPHPLSSYSSVFGSFGSKLSVGELGLSNKGILFLDEFPEFNRLVIEGLRAPLEDKKVSLSRAGVKTQIDADFILVCTANPCKCGFYNHSKVNCVCSPVEIRRYQSRISGPVLDRIDIKLFLSENNKMNSIEYKNYSKYEYDTLKKIIFEKYKLRKTLLDTEKGCNNNVNNMYTIIVQKYFPEKIYNKLNNELKNTSISDRVKIKLINLIFTICLFNDREIINLEDVIEGISLVVKKVSNNPYL